MATHTGSPANQVRESVAKQSAFLTSHYKLVEKNAARVYSHGLPLKTNYATLVRYCFGCW